jgi:hypothetical protein
MPWLDEEDLIPGEKWQEAIKRALADSRAVIVCLSPASVSKTGFVQKEIAVALDRAEEMPEGRIYVVPVKLVECELPPRLASVLSEKYV